MGLVAGYGVNMPPLRNNQCPNHTTPPQHHTTTHQLARGEFCHQKKIPSFFGLVIFFDHLHGILYTGRDQYKIIGYSYKIFFFPFK
jgi:hypothetical protein